MQKQKGPVFVLADDAMARNKLLVTLARAGFGASAYVDIYGLLAACRKMTPLCVLVDVQQEGVDGEVIKRFKKFCSSLPVILLSERATIPEAVLSIKAGAYDFLGKPVALEVLVSSLDGLACRTSMEKGETCGLENVTWPGLEHLTVRERDILGLILSGLTSKQAAARLHISPRTLEDVRLRIMRKLGARNVMDILCHGLQSSKTA